VVWCPSFAIGLPLSGRGLDVDVNVLDCGLRSTSYIVLGHFFKFHVIEFKGKIKNFFRCIKQQTRSKLLGNSPETWER
jgi:hypothetical protein